jgi:predicted short-subunit dehydrogenase-like oxidoreductase (DUF2520 family)
VQARRLAAGSEGRAGNETGTEPSGIAERELERKLEKSKQTELPGGRTVIGTGRLGGSIRRALESGGLDATGVGRDFDPESLVGRVVLVCVPDDEIAAVVERIAASGVRPRLVGHTSGATGLDVLEPIVSEDGVFSLHPLQTVPDDETDLRGAPAAVAGSSDQAIRAAHGLAESLGMIPFEVEEEMRALYHAAASVASNFLITLEQEAAVMLERAGVEEPRRVLAPLVRRSLENWIERGPEALTGPVARGDRETVESHRLTIGLHAPELLDLYDALVSRTESLARGEVSG